jgi:hypothetical protein
MTEKEYWIQGSIHEGKKGSFRQKADRRRMTSKQFALKVMANPEHYDMETRKQANEALNLIRVTEKRFGTTVK